MSAPKMTFETFVISLGTATLVALGEIDNPVTKKKDKNIDIARQNIDILELLELKTKGNLNDQETKFLNQVLYEVRLKFVSANKPS